MITGQARSKGHVGIYCEFCTLIRFETHRPGCCLSLGKGPQKCFETLCGNAGPAHTWADLRRGRQQARAQRPDSCRRVTWRRPCMCPVAALALLYVESADSARCPLVTLKTLRESVYPLSNKKADLLPFSRSALSLPFFGRFQGDQRCNPHGHWVCAETLAFFMRDQGFQYPAKTNALPASRPLSILDGVGDRPALRNVCKCLHHNDLYRLKGATALQLRLSPIKVGPPITRSPNGRNALQRRGSDELTTGLETTVEL